LIFSLICRNGKIGLKFSEIIAFYGCSLLLLKLEGQKVTVLLGKYLILQSMDILIFRSFKENTSANHGNNPALEMRNYQNNYISNISNNPLINSSPYVPNKYNN
jgi:hypothetical protein